MTGGDFTPEAYEQLREAYAKDQEEARTIEERGKDIMGLNLGLETAPVDSPWADKIPKWNYPSGKSQYLDEHQDPAEILELMRNSATEKLEAQAEEPEEDEEVKEDDDALEDEGEVEVEDKEEEESDEDEEEESEEESDDNDEEEVEEESDDEEDTDDAEPEEAETEEGDADIDAVAAQIAELRAELEQMQFVADTKDDESE